MLERMEGHSWKYHASGRCAAPICGAGIPPSKPSYPCSEAERDISNIPEFEARLRERFRNRPVAAGRLPRRLDGARPRVRRAGSPSQAGCPVTFSRTTQTVEPGIYQVVVEYSERRSAAWPSNWRRTSAAPPMTTPFELARCFAPPARTRRGRPPRARAPVRSSMPRWRATSPTAA